MSLLTSSSSPIPSSCSRRKRRKWLETDINPPFLWLVLYRWLCRKGLALCSLNPWPQGGGRTAAAAALQLHEGTLTTSWRRSSAQASAGAGELDMAFLPLSAAPSLSLALSLALTLQEHYTAAVSWWACVSPRHSFWLHSLVMLFTPQSRPRGFTEGRHRYLKGKRWSDQVVKQPFFLSSGGTTSSAGMAGWSQGSQRGCWAPVRGQVLDWTIPTGGNGPPAHQ